MMLQQRIQTFLEVANCLSFSSAARNLYISQQAVTKQIASLEQELGLRLFYRTTRQVTLNPQPEVFCGIPLRRSIGRSAATFARPQRTQQLRKIPASSWFSLLTVPKRYHSAHYRLSHAALPGAGTGYTAVGFCCAAESAVRPAAGSLHHDLQ